MGFKRQAIHNWEQYLSMSDEGHRMVKEQIVRLLGPRSPQAPLIRSRQMEPQDILSLELHC